MNWSRENTILLRNYMARTYPMLSDITTIVGGDLGFPLGKISLETKSVNTWFNVIQFASKIDRVNDILVYAKNQAPNNELLQQLEKGITVHIPEGNKAGNWHNKNSKQQLEKIINAKSTLISIRYFEQALVQARSVVRIKVSKDSVGNTYGTGFLTNDNFLITNNHVLPNADTAKDCIIQFNYQENHQGLSLEVEDALLNPEIFSTSIEHDWTIVKLKEDAAMKWGGIVLNNIQPSVDSYVNIIQHPMGEIKQAALSSNVIVFVDENIVQYLTDTQPGSSGSPVFDMNWNVVALHRSGGWIEEPNSPSGTSYYRNEGTNINHIIDQLNIMRS